MEVHGQGPVCSPLSAMAEAKAPSQGTGKCEFWHIKSESSDHDSVLFLQS